MASPYSKTTEFDKSGHPSPFVGLYAAVIGNFDKGRVGEKVFVTSVGDMDVSHGKPRVGSDIAYFIAHTYLQKSRRLWAYRIVGAGAKFGAISLGSSFKAILGSGDGTEVSFSGTAAYGRCIPGTVTLWIDGVKVAYDNPATGALIGTRVVTGSINYFTGAVAVQFSTAIQNGAEVSVRWGFQPVQITNGIADVDEISFTRELSLVLAAKVDRKVTDRIVPAPIAVPATILDETDATLKVYDGTTLIAYADEYGNFTDMGSYMDTAVKERTTITCEAASTLTPGRYFTIHATFPHVLYYVWYEIDGEGVDPEITAATGVKVEILSTDTAELVAEKTAAVLDALVAFVATTETNGDVIVESNTVGHAEDAADVNTGFTITVSQQGVSAGTINYSTGAFEINLKQGFTPSGILNVTFKSAVADYAMVLGESVGDWINGLFDLVVNRIDENRNYFDFSIYEKKIGQPDIERCNYVVSNDIKMDGYGIGAFMEDRINGKDSYVQVIYNQAVSDVVVTVYPTVFMAHNSFARQRIDFLGGHKGAPVSVDDYITAAESFSNRDDVKCNILIDSTGDPQVQQKYLQVCDRELGGRGDCYAVNYIPFDVEMSSNFMADAIEYRKYALASSSSFGGLYIGHVLIRDTYNARDIYIPPSGFVAAAFSYTADQYEPWFIAAGWKRGVLPVTDLYRKLSQAQRDLLYDEGINAMKFKAGRGVAIWGNKTLYPDISSRSRANVRWLLIVVQNAIEDYNEMNVFDINDPITRNEIRVVLLNYLAGIKNRRGLYDFDVQCNDINNDGAVVNAFKMNVDYYLQPTQGAEFVNNRSVLTPSGVSFDEFRL